MKNENSFNAVNNYELYIGQLTNSLDEVLFITDELGHFKFLNTAWESQMEYGIEESLNVPYYNFLHHEDFKKNVDLFISLVDNKSGFFKHETRYVAKSGVVKWMESYTTVLRNDQNTFLGISGRLRDMSSEKRTQYYYQHYELFSKHSTDLICIIGKDTSFMFIIGNVKKVLGYDPDELYSKTIYDILHPDDYSVIKEMATLKLKSNSIGDYSKQVILRIQKKDGNYTFLELDVNLFFDDYDRKYKFLAISRVVDLRIKAEYDMKMALEREKNLNELKSKFISIASHEFKTPLTSIKLTVELLSKYINRGIKGVNFLNSLNVIGNEIDKLAFLINDILLLEKSNYGGMQFHQESFDLIDFLKKIIDNHSLWGKKNIRSIKLIFTEGKRFIIADKNLLYTIIINLLSNAYKFSEGQPSPVIEVKFFFDEITISVRDYGIGIPESEIKNIFGSFYRANNVGEIEGTGLGLNIVKKFVEIHSGYLEVFSITNKGTEIVVHIPQKNNKK